jgi:flagellar motor switch/type III secretory pathway protein FliN
MAATLPRDRDTMPSLNHRSQHCMTAIVFDTLAYMERLEGAGFTREQANGQAHALRDLFADQIATSQDIADLSTKIEKTEADLARRIDRTEADLARRIDRTEVDLTRKIEKTEADLTTKIDQVRIDLTMMITETKTELIKWHIGSVLAMAALIVGLVKFGN